jgi:hypothetical protein
MPTIMPSNMTKEQEKAYLSKLAFILLKAFVSIFGIIKSSISQIRILMKY